MAPGAVGLRREFADRIWVLAALGVKLFNRPVVGGVLFGESKLVSSCFRLSGVNLAS